MQSREQRVKVAMAELAKKCTLEVKVQITGTKVFEYKVKLIKSLLWICVKIGGFKGYKVQFTGGSLEAPEPSKIIIPNRRLV